MCFTTSVIRHSSYLHIISPILYPGIKFLSCDCYPLYIKPPPSTITMMPWFGRHPMTDTQRTVPWDLVSRPGIILLPATVHPPGYVRGLLLQGHHQVHRLVVKPYTREGLHACKHLIRSSRKAASLIFCISFQVSNYSGVLGLPGFKTK